MYPGAVLALALAYVSGQRSLFLWMPVIAAVSAVAIGAGGMMSYGILHGYAQSDTLINYGYGFLTLFLQGSAWGTIGGALIGLLLEREPMRTQEWLGLIGSVLFAGWITSYLVVDMIGFQINPPRNNGSIAFMGAALGQLIWLAYRNKPSGMRGAVLGYAGFGLGMTIGRLLGNYANVLQTELGFTINHWNVMETSCGFIAGFIYCFGMVGRPYPEPTEDKDIRLVSVYGIIYVLGLIPLWHRLGRIPPATKLPEWTRAFQTYGYSHPEGLAQTILWLVDGVCVLGFVGAAIWLVIHFQQRQGWAVLPVLWLSGTMLLFQNLTAHYLLYPARPKYINMHHVFWILFILMLVYAALARPRAVTLESGAEAENALRFVWVAWLAGAAVILGLVVVLAGHVNNEKTMATANTRWPVWAWPQGPFPGRSARP